MTDRTTTPSRICILMLAGVFLPCGPLAAQARTTVTPDWLRANTPTLATGPSSKVIYRSAQGDTVEMGRAWETLTLEGTGEAAHFVRIQGRDMGGRTAADTVTFRAVDLAPLSRVSHAFDGTRWDLGFSRGRARGTNGSTEGSIDLTNQGGFFDQNVLDYLCVVLAGIGGGPYDVPLFSESDGGIVTYQVTVRGQEQISGAAGPVTAVRVDYEGPSGPLASVWVDTDAHHAVREGMSPAPGMEIFMIPTRANDPGAGAPF